MLRRAVQRHREDHVSRRKGGKLKIPGQDSDYMDLATVNINGSFEDMWIAAEMPLPQSVGDHHYKRTVGAILLRQKVPSQDRRDSKEWEEARLEADAVELRWVVLNQVAGMRARALACE